MATTAVVWVIDTSSIIEIRRATELKVRADVFVALTRLVNAGRLVYPPQVLEELSRYAHPKEPDPQYLWARANEATACESCRCSFDEVREILAEVPTVLDPQKDGGADEADPYVLASARLLRRNGSDARVVTQETKDTRSKMSMNTAAGILGIPSIPLLALLATERISIS